MKQNTPIEIFPVANGFLVKNMENVHRGDLVPMENTYVFESMQTLINFLQSHFKRQQ